MAAVNSRNRFMALTSLAASFLSAAVPSLAQNSDSTTAPPTAPAANSPAAVTDQSPPDDTQAYTLQYKFAAGQIRNYKMSMVMTGTLLSAGRTMPLNTETDTLFAQTVDTVNPDGSANISSHLISGQVTSNGRTAPLSDAQIQQMQASMPPVTMTPYGNEATVDGAGAIAGLGANPMQFVKMAQAQTLPTNPIKVGDLWRGSIGFLGLTYTNKSTLTGVSQGPDGQVAQIGTATYGSTNSAGTTLSAGAKMYMQVSGAGTTDFNITTGSLQDADSSITSKVTVAPPPTKKLKGKTAAPARVRLRFTMKTHMELLGTPASAADTPAGPATSAQ